MSGASDAGARLAAVLAGAGTDEWRDTDVGPLHEAALAHGVAALLWERLSAAAGAGATLRDRLHGDVRAAVSRDVLTQRELRRALDALSTRGVRTLVVKGAALASTVYPSSWMRPRVDTDILVPQCDVAAAASALEAAGYARSDALSTGDYVSHQIAFERIDHHGGRHVIDLHWKIVNPQALANTLAFDDLWERGETAADLGPHARVPAVHASLVLACIHRLAHHRGHDRLIWLYDLRLLASRADADEWRRFVEVATTRRVAGLCLDGLHAAARTGCEVPPAVTEALAAAAPGEPSRIYLQAAMGRRDILVSDLKALSSWRARLQLVREHLLPPSSFIRHRYGLTKWPLPVLYLHRLLAGASKWVR